MADENDLLGKADALLRRHAPPRADPAHTEVPRLTELITPGAPPAADLEPPPDPAGLPMLALELEPPASAAEPARDDAQLARELATEVAADVEARLAQELERRLALHLQDEVQAAVAAALGELRQEITNAAREAVVRALRRRDES